MFAIPVARWAGTPAVIASELSYRSLILRGHHRYIFSQTEQAAHKIVVNSAAVKTDLVENSGVPASKVVLSHNGVDLNAFHPGGRVRKVFREASVLVGAVCALRPEKRLDLLVDAFAEVKQVSDGARLLIVGSGSMLESLQDQARRLQIQDACHFEPSKTEVTDWMRSIDGFVMCSESESFPNALLEAMACGCCVIGSRVGGVPELITDETSGLLFESRSADDLGLKLKRVLEDSALRQRLAEEAARTAAQQFPSAAAVDRMERLYASLLNHEAASHENSGRHR